jgi:hypothetical protein
MFCNGDPRKATAACGKVEIDDAALNATLAETETDDPAVQ